MKIEQQRLRLSPSMLIFLASAPLMLAGSGCGAKQPPAAPAVSAAQSTAAKIKSVENDPRMPADVKAREIARIKAENQGTP